MADDPVVVSKAGPMKASNGVEGKTWLTFANACKGVNRCQKHGELRRGEAYVKTVMSGLFFFGGYTSRLISGTRLCGLIGNSEAATCGRTAGVTTTRWGRLPVG